MQLPAKRVGRQHGDIKTGVVQNHNYITFKLKHMTNWMIFRSDIPSPEYFLYNGERVINITPVATPYTVFGEPGRPLEDCYNSPRKKMFVNNKVRYTVLGRGKFTAP